MKHHLAPNDLKRGRTEEEIEQDEATTDFTAHKLDADTKIVVHKAIGQLPAEQRRIIVLRFFEEETVEECAESMGIDPARARILYREACLGLKAILGRAGLDKRTK